MGADCSDERTPFFLLYLNPYGLRLWLWSVTKRKITLFPASAMVTSPPRRRPLPSLILYLLFQAILNIQTGRSSDKLVSTYQTRRCHITKYHNTNQRLICKQASYFRTHLLTYLLTPWSRVLLEKLTGFAANQEIPRILWNPKVHYRTHLSLSWANPIQSQQPLPTSWRFILILSSHLRLGLPNGLFPSGFPTKTLVYEEHN